MWWRRSSLTKRSPDGAERNPGRARERVGCSRITLRSIRATFLMRWEADERPEPRSLGLLPSGPDPVGEWLVHRQPPGDYIGRGGGESKHRRAFACGQWTHTVECPLG